MGTYRRNPKPGFPQPTEEGDRIFNFKMACDLFGVSKHVMYKWNDNGIPYYKPGKTCFYLYSEVMNWFLSYNSLADGVSYKAVPLSQLPKCWPVYPGDEPMAKPQKPQKADEGEAV